MEMQEEITFMVELKCHGRTQLLPLQKNYNNIPFNLRYENVIFQNLILKRKYYWWIFSVIEKITDTFGHCKIAKLIKKVIVLIPIR